MKSRISFCVLTAVILFLLLACSSNKSAVKDEQALPVAPAPVKLEAYRIQPGDELDVKFFYNPELNETVMVRPDGKISLQLVDEVDVVGLSPAELDELLSKKYSRELRKPVLTVIVRSFSRQRVFVGGEVVRPGLISLSPGMQPIQAVFSAGGLRETANPDGAIIIRKGPDNKPIPQRLDLSDAMIGKGEGAEFELQPDDIVYIPKSGMAVANKFIDEFVRGILMFNGWSFGFSYQVKADQRD
jgi:protein involved in polysaccharide export with SLBB domain